LKTLGKLKKYLTAWDGLGVWENVETEFIKGGPKKVTLTVYYEEEVEVEAEVDEDLGMDGNGYDGYNQYAGGDDDDDDEFIGDDDDYIPDAEYRNENSRRATSTRTKTVTTTEVVELRKFRSYDKLHELFRSLGFQRKPQDVIDAMQAEHERKERIREEKNRERREQVRRNVEKFNEDQRKRKLERRMRLLAEQREREIDEQQRRRREEEEEEARRKNEL